MKKDPANTAQPTQDFWGVCLGGLFWVGQSAKWLRG